MFKLIWRLGCLSVLLVIAFVLYSMWRGGDVFRDVGGKTGGLIKEGSQKIGDKADKIKETTDAVKGTAKKLSDTFAPADGGKAKDATDKKDDK